MKLKTPSLSILAAVMLPAALFAGNSSVVRSPLENTKVDADAIGSVLSVLQSNRSLFSVELGKLDARQNYSLKVGEIVEAVFATDSKGRARVRFTTQIEKNKLPLDFDPRGKTVAVLDANGVAVLQAVISSAGEPAGISVDERANLSASSSGKGSVRYAAQKNGKRSFEIALSGLTATGLHLYVDGIDRGEIEVHGKAGKAAFRSEPKGKQTLLNFDPRGAQIDLIDADGLLHFSGKLEAKAKGVNMATRATNRIIIASTGADPDGLAEAALRVRDDARKDFSVEIENVEVGAYELLVNDAVQGTINVTARAGGGTQGELEFTSKADDDAHELPLTFEPVGAAITIRQGTTVFFAGLFDPATAAPNPQALIVEALTSTGLDANASGEVEFSTQPNGETELEVETEDVDAGAYQFFVGGTLRGTISVVADASARVRGKLKFEKAGSNEAITRSNKRGGSDDGGGDDHGGGGGKDDPAGDDHGGTGGGGTGGGDVKTPSLPLNFDPRGQLLEIKSAAGTFFSHLLGDGSAPVAGGGGTAAVPGEITVALISSGVDSDATAKAEWARNDRGGESFEVEIEDLSTGSYDVIVGETIRGSVTVVESGHGTRGKIKFEDEPSAGELALDFDPLGQTITVQKAGVAYFQRTFPSGI